VERLLIAESHITST